MKKLLVLGPGCPRCETLANLTRQAADQRGIAYELEKLTGQAEEVQLPVLRDSTLSRLTGPSTTVGGASGATMGTGVDALRSKPGDVRVLVLERARPSLNQLAPRATIQ